MSRQLSSSRKHSIELPNKQLKQQNGVFSKRRLTHGLKKWGLGCGIFTKGHRRRETFASMFLFSSGQPLSKPMVQALNLIMKLKNISSGQKKTERDYTGKLVLIQCEDKGVKSIFQRGFYCD